MALITEYSQEFDERARRVLSVPLRNTDYLCHSFGCSRSTIDIWLADHPSFADSVAQGLLSGEQKFRKLLFALSLYPANKVNTKLLTLMAYNVYNIKEDTQPTVVIREKQFTSVEEELAERGIPIPRCEVPDFDYIDACIEKGQIVNSQE